MKKKVLALCLLWAASAGANDSGMPYIEVNDLTFTEADVGTKISFRGPEAMSFFNALPSMDVMDSQRGFTATGKKKSVAIICESTKFNEKSGQMDPIANGPICTISVGKVFVPGEGDDSKWINSRAPQSVKEDKKSVKKK